jgi:DNA-binding MurR/RpiR family transcriptional regulator
LEIIQREDLLNKRASLEDRILANIEQMSSKHKRLASFVLDNKVVFSFTTASQLAARTGTSAATVVRFAQALGYKGFSEMRSVIRSEMPSYMTSVERMQARLGRHPDQTETSDSIFATDIRNIERTAGNLLSVQLDEAVQKISKAGHILVVGSGLSSASALLLAHSLKVIGLDARAVLHGGLVQAVELANLDQNSLLIVIDLWRYTRSAIRAVEYAARSNIPNIAITDSLVSPLAEAADIVFEVATESSYHSVSTTAVVALINVLVSMLSYTMPDKALESLRRVEAAYRSSDLLVTD